MSRRTMNQAGEGALELHHRGLVNALLVDGLRQGQDDASAGDQFWLAPKALALCAGRLAESGG
ncbi:hypothetical protein [Streptomyces shenzhenensis]|uniref:hypothetical protein n=1 Tax=Streptomyces shenzhenensis TaxID=943815 RepID=UPI0036920E63